jgi:hypothetical protein
MPESHLLRPYGKHHLKPFRIPITAEMISTTPHKSSPVLKGDKIIRHPRLSDIHDFAGPAITPLLQVSRTEPPGTEAT